MKLVSSSFGELEYLEEDVIKFEEGLFGFNESKEFLFIESDDPNFHFHWLQSVKEPELTFVVTSPFLFAENYNFDLDDDLVEKLSIEKIEDITILSLVKIPESVEESTINLQAPLLINVNTKMGKQIILEETFPLRFFIFKKELNERV